MKVIIAGSRSINSMEELEAAIAASGFTISEVVCGCANGVDTLGEWWAKKNEIPVTYFPAEWGKYGKTAGFKRNAEMANYGEALIALWDGASNGTRNMVNQAKIKNLPVFLCKVAPPQV